MIVLTYRVDTVYDEDIKAVEELFMETYGETEITDQMEELFYGEEQVWLGFYDNSHTLMGVAVIEDTPIRDSSYLGFFAMKKELRGKGLGKEFMRKLYEYIQEEYGDDLMLLEVEQDNENARRFYEKLGFKYLDDRAKYDLVMFKRF